MCVSVVPNAGEDTTPRDCILHPRCLSVLIFTHTANSVLLLPPVTSRPETSLFWLVESAASLPLRSGWKDAIDYTEIPLVWNLAVDIVSIYAGNSNQWNISRESTHLAFVFFSIIAYCLIVFFLNDFVTFFVYFCQWSTFIGVLF